MNKNKQPYFFVNNKPELIRYENSSLLCIFCFSLLAQCLIYRFSSQNAQNLKIVQLILNWIDDIA